MAGKTGKFPPPNKDATLKHLVYLGVPFYGMVATNKIASKKEKVVTHSPLYWCWNYSIMSKDTERG